MRLIYWPNLPGRGDFVRLVLEDAGVAYIDVARLPVEQGGGVPTVLRARKTSAGFAPPYLLDGEQMLSQVCAICDAVATQHGLVGSGTYQRSLALQLGLSIADVVSEIHDTHHPLSTTLTFEEQREAAVEAARMFRENRLPVWIAYFERVRALHQGPGLAGEVTWADLHLFQLIRGLRHAFPRATARVLNGQDELVALVARISERPGVQRFLESRRSIPFNEHGLFRAYPELDDT